MWHIKKVSNQIYEIRFMGIEWANESLCIVLSGSFSRSLPLVFLCLRSSVLLARIMSIIQPLCTRSAIFNGHSRTPLDKGKVCLSIATYKDTHSAAVGNQTWVNCVEGNNANHCTTNATTCMR